MKRKTIRRLKSDLKKMLKTIKTRNMMQYSEGDYMIRQYEDYMMGEWFGNEELWYKGTLHSHATLTELMKPEQLPDRLHELIRIDEEVTRRYLERLIKS